MVKGSNNSGKWNETPAILQIEILPPFWRTWWFRSTILIFFITIVVGWTISHNYNLRKKKNELEKLVYERTKKINLQNKVLEKQTDDLITINEQLKEKQTEILEQKNSIEQMAEQLKEATNNKLSFFTNISHEFRTPLSLILGPIQQILNNETNPEKKKYLSIVYRNAQRLFSLINQLIEIRKIDQNKLTLKLEQTDIVQFCKDIIMLFTNLAIDSKIELVFNSSFSEYKLWFDLDKVEKIIYNIISNALKFTPDGGKVVVSITLDSSQNKIKENTSDYLIISVADSGIGIELSKIDRLFDRFYQIEHRYDGKYGGTGIGLSYAKELIEVHKGKIEVESEPGRGSVFNIYLPIDTKLYPEDSFNKMGANFDYTYSRTFLTNNLITSDSKNDEEAEPERLRDLILVVDDNKDFLDFIITELSSKYELISAPNGEVALNKTLKYLPDLVLCDEMMPKLNGIEYLKILKNDMAISHIPVIILTAKSDEQFAIAGYETGADDYITKPFSIDMLKSRIKNVIDNRDKLRKTFTKSFYDTKSTEVFSGQTLEKKFIEKAIQVIEKNLDEQNFDNKKLASEMLMGKSQLYSKLKTLTGKTAHEFIKSVRLKKSLEFLVSPEYNISDVAYMTGFNSPIYFSKCFKEFFGISPSEYQKDPKLLS